MTLQRLPFPHDLPFDRVSCERGYLHVQCTVCGGHRRVVDLLAVTLFRSRRLGNARLMLQTPTMFTGALRFIAGHLHCLQVHQGLA